MVAPAASVLFRVPEGTPEVGQAPLATVMVNGFAVAEGVMVAAIVVESMSGTSPVLVMEKQSV